MYILAMEVASPENQQCVNGTFFVPYGRTGRGRDTGSHKAAATCQGWLISSSMNALCVNKHLLSILTLTSQDITGGSPVDRAR